MPSLSHNTYFSPSDTLSLSHNTYFSPSDMPPYPCNTNFLPSDMLSHPRNTPPRHKKKKRAPDEAPSTISRTKETSSSGNPSGLPDNDLIF